VRARVSRAPGSPLGDAAKPRDPDLDPLQVPWYCVLSALYQTHQRPLSRLALALLWNLTHPSTTSLPWVVGVGTRVARQSACTTHVGSHLQTCAS
jgi:hypothetical protein